MAARRRELVVRVVPAFSAGGGAGLAEPGRRPLCWAGLQGRGCGPRGGRGCGVGPRRPGTTGGIPSCACSTGSTGPGTGFGCRELRGGRHFRWREWACADRAWAGPGSASSLIPPRDLLTRPVLPRPRGMGVSRAGRGGRGRAGRAGQSSRPHLWLRCLRQELDLRSREVSDHGAR